MWLGTIKRGFHMGVKTTWLIGKIIFPITLFVSILQHTPVMDWLIQWIAPLMGLIGLSGDAAIPLVLGMTLNLYAAVAGALSIELTVKEVFIIVMMLSFCHALIIESAVSLKVGVKMWLVVTVRLGLAILSAIFIHLIWDGGSEIAQYGLIQLEDSEVKGIIPILISACKQASLGLIQLILIVMPLMLFIQFLKDYNGLRIFSKLMSPFTRMLGLNQNAATTLAAGFIFGLAYGAGVMIDAVKHDGVSQKDITLSFIFLLPCHAIIEDTLIFLPLGVPVWMILIIRFTTALLLAVVVKHIWWKQNNSVERKIA